MEVLSSEREGVEAAISGEPALKIQNISLGGVCIQTPSFEEIGTVVDLVINFPDLASNVVVRGQVVWANREPPIELGIRYIDLDETRKHTLQRYVQLVQQRDDQLSARG